MDEDDLNGLKDASEALSNILKSDDDDVVEQELLKFEYACYNIFYGSLMDGLIYDKDSILDTLDFYLRVDNVKKYNISAILNKHYPNSLQEKFDEYIKEENYELCKLIKELLNYNTINYDK